MKISKLAPFCLRRFFVLLLAASLTGWLSACSTTGPVGDNDPKSAWVLFTDDAGGFSVLMPMRPQESVKAHSGTNGPAVESHEFIVDPDSSIEIGVIYNDYPGSSPHIEAIGSPWFFDTVQEAELKLLGEGRLIYARDGKFASHPMREVQFEVPAKNLMYQTRIIVVGHRMYQLIVASSRGVDVSRDVATLFNSFHLLYDEPR